MVVAQIIEGEKEMKKLILTTVAAGLATAGLFAAQGAFANSNVASLYNNSNKSVTVKFVNAGKGSNVYNIETGQEDSWTIPANNVSKIRYTYHWNNGGPGGEMYVSGGYSGELVYNVTEHCNKFGANCYVKRFYRIAGPNNFNINSNGTINIGKPHPKKCVRYCGFGWQRKCCAWSSGNGLNYLNLNKNINAKFLGAN